MSEFSTDIAEVVDKIIEYTNTSECADDIVTASEKGNLEMVMKFVEDGVHIDASDKEGRTPICVASEMGHMEVVKYLGELGADVTQPDNDGFTPITKASMNGHSDIMRALIGFAVANNDRNRAGCRCLDCE